jgi:hypothetical protein
MGPLLAGMVVLAIGDSQLMMMMSPLQNQLEDAGATVHSYAMCGATAGDWLYPSTITSCGRAERHERGAIVLENTKAVPTYSLPKLIEEHHPNLIIVQLGDMMAGYGQPHLDQQWIVNQVHALTAKIAASHIACDWVGLTWGQNIPPYPKEDARVKEMAQLLSQSVSPCQFIDSTAFARPGQWATKDGGHLLPDGYRQWSADITEAVERLRNQSAAASH